MAQNSSQQQLKPVSDSLFYMWRCIIVMAHADGVIHESEQEFFDKVFASMGMTYAVSEKQQKTFADDLAAAQNIDDLLPHVTDLECRAMLLYFSQIVAWIDGALSPSEATLLKKLNASRSHDANSEKIMTRIQQDIADQMFQRKKQFDKTGQNPLIHATAALLLRLGIEPPV